LWNQQRCSFVCREDVAQRFPEAQRTVADREDRGAHAAAAAVAQQVGPRLVRLAEPVGQRDELFASVRAHPDHHQQAQFLLLQPNFQVNPVGPQVDVVHTREVAGGEGAGLVLPLRR
jgi:hypothetical protein